MSLVGGNSSGISRSLHGVNTNGGGSINIDAVRDFYRFQQLYNSVLVGLNIYLSYFNDKDIKNLGTIIQISELKGLMINVNNDSIYNNSTITNVEDFLYNANVFPSFRTSMYDIITGLELAIQMNLSINTLTTENVRLSTFEHNVNTNSTFITQYINSKNLEILPFDVATIYDQDIMLQPWYAEYLFQYGPPSNGVFITEKLVDIVNGLISNGVITMNDFINS